MEMETMTVPATSAQISGNVLLYSQPEPLNREQHGTLGFIRSSSPYKFAATSHVIPLTSGEFIPASLCYPIIFVGDQRQPAAVMGLRPGENLFIEGNGAFAMDAYVPAYIRRYPFVLANDQAHERNIVCIDRGAEALVEGGEVKLFENGEPSQFTQSAIEFCNNFEMDRQRTNAFVELMGSLDLFEVKRATFTPRVGDGSFGEPQTMAEYFGVDEQKLKDLEGDKFLEMRTNGALPLIYAHLISLLNWDKLVARSVMRQGLTPATPTFGAA